MVGAVVLTGAPGAGKSSVLEALSTLLEIEGVRHGAIESEELSRGFPPLGASAWLPQLAAVLAAQRDAGRDLFLVAATTEDGAQLRGVLDAAAAERALVVCLAAPAPERAARLERREPDAWPGKAGLIEHARRLAGVVPALAGVELAIDTTGREPDAVALEVRAAMRAGGLGPAGQGEGPAPARAPRPGPLSPS